MLVIAHRGASAYTQENTLKAFELSFKLGSSWLETDIQRSKDGILVLYHDYFLKDGRKIKELTFKELSKLKVPQLSDLLKITPKNFILNLEIKNDDNLYPDIEKQILEELKKVKNIDKKQVLVSSFSLQSLQKIRAMDKDISLGVLTRKFDIKVPLSLKAKSVNISVKRITENIIRSCHKNGLKVLVYTVNDYQTYCMLENWGVDGVFSDNPVLSFPRFFELGGTL